MPVVQLDLQVKMVNITSSVEEDTPPEYSCCE